jgi:hypothetical protein
MRGRPKGPWPGLLSGLGVGSGNVNLRIRLILLLQLFWGDGLWLVVDVRDGVERAPLPVVRP